MKKLIGVWIGLCLILISDARGSYISSGGACSNVGTGAGQVCQSGSNFKTIKSGGGITVTNNTNDVTLQVSGAGNGNVTGPSPTVAGTIALTLATDGTTLQNATGTGIVKATSGVYSTVSAVGVSNGGTNSTTALNNNRFMVSSSGAVVEATAVTASRAVASDANGLPTASTTTATELGYVHGVTSAIQTQLSSLAPIDSPNFTTKVTFGNYHLDTSAPSATTCATPASATIDWSQGSVQQLTLTGTGACTLSFSNLVANGSYVLTVLNTTATITWPVAVDWGAAGAPTLSASGKYDDVNLLVRLNGTDIHGSYAQAFSH